METHNLKARFPTLNAPHSYGLALTWPGREFDQKGTAPSVEQDHCTLIAVKRYRDPPRIGGRHNFLLRPLRSSLNKKETTSNPFQVAFIAPSLLAALKPPANP